MNILTPYQIKRLCKKLFGTPATIAANCLWKQGIP